MGSRSYPIWNQVSACIYGSSKSFGAKDTSKMTVLVGSSSKNSHELGTVVTTRRQDANGIWHFKLSVDGVVIKHLKFSCNKGRVGAKIEEDEVC